MIAEIIGYIATIIVACGYAQADVLKLRLFNITGGSLFVIYSIMIGSGPFIVLNLIIVGVLAYKIWKEKTNDKRICKSSNTL